jgi:hypothetical protein
MTYPQPEDWPTDEETERRMPAIMQNGNCGEHYAALDIELQTTKP